MKFKNILFIALLFTGAAIVHQVHAMDDAALLDADGNPAGDAGENGPSSEENGDGDGDGLRDMTEHERQESYGKDGFFNWMFRSREHRLNRRIDRANGKYGRVAIDGQLREQSGGQGSTFGATGGESHEAATTSMERNLGRGLRRSISSEDASFFDDGKGRSVGAQDFDPNGTALDGNGDPIHDYPDDPFSDLRQSVDPFDVDRMLGHGVDYGSKLREQADKKADTLVADLGKELMRINMEKGVEPKVKIGGQDVKVLKVERSENLENPIKVKYETNTGRIREQSFTQIRAEKILTDLQTSDVQDPVEVWRNAVPEGDGTYPSVNSPRIEDLARSTGSSGYTGDLSEDGSSVGDPDVQEVDPWGGDSQDGNDRQSTLGNNARDMPGDPIKQSVADMFPDRFGNDRAENFDTLPRQLSMGENNINSSVDELRQGMGTFNEDRSREQASHEYVAKTLEGQRDKIQTALETGNYSQANRERMRQTIDGLDKKIREVKEQGDQDLGYSSGDGDSDSELAQATSFGAPDNSDQKQPVIKKGVSWGGDNPDTEFGREFDISGEDPSRKGDGNPELDNIEDYDEYRAERDRQMRFGEADGRERDGSLENTQYNTTPSRSLEDINAQWNDMDTGEEAQPDGRLSSEDLAKNLIGHNIAEGGYPPKRVSSARVVSDGNIRLYHEGGGATKLSPKDAQDTLNRVSGNRRTNFI